MLLRPKTAAPRPSGILCAAPTPAAAASGAWCAATTDTGGQYVFEHVPPGEYLIAADPAGAWTTR